MDNRELEFHEIYDAYQPRIFHYMTRLVGEYEAEDLTQDTFVKAGRALKDFRGESSLSTWLYRIATNVALDKMRSPSFQRIVVESLPEDSNANGETEIEDRDVWTGEKKPSVEQQFVRKEMNECILGFVESLPEDFRAVLVLSDMAGLSNGDIAETLGITLGTAKIRLHRARAKLKEALETHCENYWVEELPCELKSKPKEN